MSQLTQRQVAEITMPKPNPRQSLAKAQAVGGDRSGPRWSDRRGWG
jgi:hypothetical protein